MKTKLCLVFLSIIFLSGCAATKTRIVNKEADSLRAQVQELESKIDEKDNTIHALEQKLRAASNSAKAAPKPLPVEKQVSFTKQNIQLALKKAGCYSGDIDGKIGPKTKEAIKAFQGANGLKVDGVAGEKTKALLAKYLD